jgi:hypothetical protein
VDPPVKNAHLPHYEILARNFPALQFDLTNKMTPALPLNARTFHRFLPSAWWRAKQVLRGFTRRYLPFELFPLVDYVDYRTWIAGPSGRALLDEILDPPRMASAFLYRGSAFAEWLARQKSTGFAAFPLLDRMATLELYFREVGGP